MKIILVSLMLLGLQTQTFAKLPDKFHESKPVVDGHNDLPWTIRQSGKALKDINLLQLQKDFHTDIPRLHAGGVGLQLWSAYVPASTAKEGTALKTTLEQIELIHQIHAQYPKDLALVADVKAAKAAIAAGKIAGMIGIEGGYSIEKDLANLGKFYELGARYMTLTHSQTISWADSATDKAQHDGLTKFGEKVIAEMNRLGMLIDISHVSKAVMKQAIQLSKAPVIASHSSAAAITKHPRNIDDDVIKAGKS